MLFIFINPTLSYWFPTHSLAILYTLYENVYKTNLLCLTFRETFECVQPSIPSTKMFTKPPYCAWQSVKPSNLSMTGKLSSLENLEILWSCHFRGDRAWWVEIGCFLIDIAASWHPPMVSGRRSQILIPSTCKKTPSTCKKALNSSKISWTWHTHGMINREMCHGHGWSNFLGKNIEMEEF